MGFLLLTLEPDETRVRRAISEWKLQGQVALVTGEVLGPLSVREVPSTVFVDARGQLVAAASGPRSQRFLARRTQELLDSSR
ncbi:TlpA family protein disulfide reductase [Archangium violaceum]|uniref:TlpA family protein disulfide reductase n=1 Tax=Archangium violaceum TaxID=83451 RepID=UPI0037C17CAE